jgi:molecular chaperone GrpE
MLDNQQNEINEMEAGGEETAANETAQTEVPQDAGEQNPSNDELNTLKELLSQKETESKELMERLQRLAAEYDNFRKRTQREKEKIYSETVSEVVASFLPIVDNLERALKAAEDEESKGLKEGVTLIFRQLSDILAKLGVKPIEAVGAEFDPQYHNAVMHVEDEQYGHNIIVEEFQKGYIYKDEIVIRHSMVKVAN